MKYWLLPPYLKETWRISAYPHPLGSAYAAEPGAAKVKLQTISWIPFWGGMVKTEEPPAKFANCCTYLVFWVVGNACFFDVSAS
jgi:hypothetical protein